MVVEEEEEEKEEEEEEEEEEQQQGKVSLFPFPGTVNLHCVVGTMQNKICHKTP